MIKAGSSEIALPTRVIAENDRTLPHAAASADHAARLEDLAGHIELVWRFACRMGLAQSEAEDIAQESFVLAASKVDAIVPGKERSYLLSVAMNKIRRERIRNRRQEELTSEPEAPATERPDELVDDERQRRLLDATLATLDDDLRVVFILHEIEEHTMAEIAQLVGVPAGTVASRLRRAREQWRRAVDRARRSGSVRSHA